MAKIIDYTILTNLSHHNLIKDVKAYIELEWQPLGGITTTYAGHTEYFWQAMVKYES